MTYLLSTPFKKAYEHFSYLGVIVTKKSEDLLRKNWNSKIEQLKQGINFWKTLPISLVGKINAIKYCLVSSIFFNPFLALLLSLTLSN